MNEIEFKEITKQLALRTINLANSLPNTVAAQVIGRQIIRSATSSAANYRAACRGKSPADMLHKLTIVEEEADETMYWLELLADSGMIPRNRLDALLNDFNEVVSMTVVSIKTLKSKKKSDD